jgi:hypothetical protein
MEHQVVRPKPGPTSPGGGPGSESIGDRSRPRSRFALVVAVIVLATVASCSVPVVGARGRTNISGASVSAAVAAKPTFIGPILGKDETPTLSLGRDGGVSVPLPDGRDLWIFGDTPRFQYQHGKWNLTGFIQGSSAGMESYTTGHMLAGPLDEVVPGHKLTARNQATLFIPPPRVYLPNRGGLRCTKANAGPSAGEGRWATGAALMPDHTNVLIPFVDVCVTSSFVETVEGWGFTEYNWKINKFSVGATDVFPPATNGAATPRARWFGSPIIADNKVTFFSVTCCKPGIVYRTTVAASVAALRKPGSYVPTPVSGLPAALLLHVAPPSRTQPHLTMMQVVDTRGKYAIYTAATPTGNWTKKATGSLPRCLTSPGRCGDSVYLHPELSTTSRMVVTYYLPGFGPGVATAHPYPHLPLWHTVAAYLPV